MVSKLANTMTTRTFTNSPLPPIPGAQQNPESTLPNAPFGSPGSPGDASSAGSALYFLESARPRAAAALPALHAGPPGLELPPLGRPAPPASDPRGVPAPSAWTGGAQPHVATVLPGSAFGDVTPVVPEPARIGPHTVQATAPASGAPWYFLESMSSTPGTGTIGQAFTPYVAGSPVIPAIPLADPRAAATSAFYFLEELTRGRTTDPAGDGAPEGAAPEAPRGTPWHTG